MPNVILLHSMNDVCNLILVVPGKKTLSGKGRLYKYFSNDHYPSQGNPINQQKIRYLINNTSKCVRK